jgi:uncharacterized caspase-like protein
VDFLPYLREIHRERMAGAKRTRAAGVGWLRSPSAGWLRLSKASSTTTTAGPPPSRALTDTAPADRYVHASRDLSAQ